MVHLTELLTTHPLLILDGAMATELEQRGCDLNDALWSARILWETPALIEQVHYDYFVAGADIAITASYQATFEGFAQRGLSHTQAVELLQRSVRLAQQARERFWHDPTQHQGRLWPLVAASIGPYGAFLADGAEYHGHYGLSQEQLINFHRERMATLLAAQPDLLACETIPCLEEAVALTQLLQEFPAATAWISFSCRDGQHTNQGEPISECARVLESSPQIVAIGVNCTAPEYVGDLIQALRQTSSKPIVVYPNSGEVYHADGNHWSGEASCEAFGAQAALWQQHGAQIIGGCCRTTPAHIHQIDSLRR